MQIPHILRLEVYELNLNSLCSPTSEHFSQLKTVYSNEARNKAPTKAEEPFLRPLVLKEERINGPASADQGFLQPAKTAAICMAGHDGLHQLITCGQSFMTSTLIISG